MHPQKSHNVIAKPVDVFVCVTCRHPNSEERVGEQFYKVLSGIVDASVQLHPVECLSVCKRPCTVAVSSANKWTYVIGDLDSTNNMDALLNYINTYALSEYGTPPLKERPAAIRKGTIARIPPLKGQNYA